MTLPFAFGQTDRHGSRDKESQLDSFSVSVMEGGKRSERAVEGHLYEFWYMPAKSPTSSTSALQILRNDQNAARTSGGQVLYEPGSDDDRQTTIRPTKGASEGWLAIGRESRGPLPRPSRSIRNPFRYGQVGTEAGVRARARRDCRTAHAEPRNEDLYRRAYRHGGRSGCKFETIPGQGPVGGEFSG